MRRSRGDGSVFYDKINGSWYGTVDLGRDGSGRRRRGKTSAQRTKTAALRELRELRNRLTAGEVVDHERATVSSAVVDFTTRGLSPKLASTTVYGIRLYAERFAQACGGRTLRQLTTREVEDYLETLAAEGKSPRTLALARATAVRVLDHAARLGWLTPGRNVAKLARLPGGRVSTPRARLDDDAVRALLAAAEGERWRPMLATVAVTGCRIGEAVALAWSDVDPADSVISIVAAARVEADGSMTRRAPKSGSVRTVAVPRALIRLLAEHRQACVEEFLAAGVPIPDLAFPTAAGTMAYPRNLSRWLDRIAAQAGVSLKGWHDLRHALGTALADGGAPLTRSAAVLGHANVQTTATVYTHPKSGVADAALGRGADLLGENNGHVEPDGTVADIARLAASLAGIDHGGLDRDRRAEWVEQLGAAIAALRTFKDALEEENVETEPTIIVECRDETSLRDIYPLEDLADEPDARLAELAELTHAAMAPLVEAAWARRGYAVRWAREPSEVIPTVDRFRSYGYAVVDVDGYGRPTDLVDEEPGVWGEAYDELDSDAVLAQWRGGES